MEYAKYPMIGVGIYAILNRTNGKHYIGSSNDLRKRKNHHLCYLRKNKHANRNLQNAFNKLTEFDFEIFCIEYCEKDSLQEREQFYLDTHTGPIYNVFKQAYSVTGENHPMFGKTHSKDAKQKIKAARANQKISHSPETRYKIGSGTRGKPANMNHIRKMVKAREGKDVWNKGLSTPSPLKVVIEISVLNYMIKEYLSGMSLSFLSKKYNIEWGIVRRNLLDNGVKIRSIKEQKKYTDARNSKRAD